LDFSRIFFDGLEGRNGKSLEKFASLAERGELVFFPLLKDEALLVNLFLMSS